MIADTKGHVVTLLDCTLRDGGFQTQWCFSDEMVRDYFDICHITQVDIVELGYLNLEPHWNTTDTGHYKALPESLNPQQQKLTEKAGDIKIAVMIDAWRITELDAQAACDIILAAIHRAPFNINILRIAALLNQLPACITLAKKLHQHGISVMLNVMQAAEFTVAELRSNLQLFNNVSIAALYFADSFGRMKPEQVFQLYHQISESINIPLGFHAHDNFGLAIANADAAIRGGATFIDGTFGGIGRGAGNAPTETLCLLRSMNGEIAQCEDFLSKHIEQLKSELQWGYSSTYRCQAKYNIHPTYAQKLFETEKLTGADRIEILRKIALHDNPKKFDINILNLYM
ncbi:homocitrate synthase [Xenorhabdus sp. BG5]|uniref:homocitrate synthase n=1 Tax=Xenorhabdus sp. BG5 TaxID=2782014 RepID=UPI001880E42D|nr:homocitrate synthase [Xenorhabdus sp. BG5]MBE8597078.1 homocitrate synthase [Xenorhabdus sp. BG5]